MATSATASAKLATPKIDHSSLVLPVGLRAIVTLAVMMATMMEILDSTIVNVALPDMMGNLGATLDQIGWVATGYIVANVIVLPLTGWLSDYLGRQRYLLYSVVLFTVASLGCGISHSLGEIIIWRIVQGAGGMVMYEADILNQLINEIYNRKPRLPALREELSKAGLWPIH